MKYINYVVYLLIILFPEAAICKSIPEIILTRPVSTPIPTLPISYFNSPCPLSATGYITCGQEFCDPIMNAVTSFRNRGSAYSYSYEYNLSAYMQFYASLPEDHCIDYDILRNPDAGYGMNELDNIYLVGILKIQESMTQDMHYVPFKTRVNPLKNLDRNKAVYELVISSMWDLTGLQDNFYPYVAAKWLSSRKSLNKVIKSQGYETPHLKKVRLPQSKLTLSLDYSSDLSGRVYDASLTGKIKTPWNNSVSARFTARSIRFARPGFNNFRKDYRYKKSVSLLPDIREYHKMSNAPYKVIEVVLVPILF